MRWLLRLFTWWNDMTLGTQVFTWRHGRKVGQDDQGNSYYESRDGKRRWVIYNGEAEASRVPPEWHGWLHYTHRDPPTKAPPRRKPWERPHQPNLTGTPQAWVPPGSLRRAQPVERRDYEAWQPE